MSEIKTARVPARKKYSTTYSQEQWRENPTAVQKQGPAPKTAHLARSYSTPKRTGQTKNNRAYELKKRDAPVVSLRKIGNSTLRIIPLGGLEEIGKNCYAIEYGPDIIILDLGIMFPDEQTPGVDYIAPDTRFLQENKNKIKGIIITHGHLDHVGAIPYLIQKLGFPPIYATELAAELIRARLSEFELNKKVTLNIFNPDKKFAIAEFEIHPFRVTHSIPDSVGYGIKTPIGTIVATGDFKFDYTPYGQAKADFHKIAGLGAEGVLLLMAESTNAIRPGYCPSETTLAENIVQIFKNAEGRIIISTFASLISRIQQIVDAARKTGRKIAISGRSLEQNLEICVNLGYVTLQDTHFIRLKEAEKYPDNELVIICTGSQGQENSALGRMANEDHANIKIGKGDTIVLSSSPIPGNERSVQNLMNRLFSLGATVVYNKLLDLHVSGHGHEEELKLMHALVRPKYFMPIHGERHMLERHSEIAQMLGTAKENIFVMRNGQVLELKKRASRSMKHTADLNKNGEVPALIGLDPTKKYNDIDANILDKGLDSQAVMIDGLGVGDIGNVVLRDRQVMAQDGMVVIITTVDKRSYKLISSPDIISRGFVYMKSSEKLIYGIKKRVSDLTNNYDRRNMENWGQLRNVIRDEIGDYLFRKTERRPMVLPVVIEV